MSRPITLADKGASAPVNRRRFRPVPPMDFVLSSGSTHHRGASFDKTVLTFSQDAPSLGEFPQDFRLPHRRRRIGYRLRERVWDERPRPRVAASNIHYALAERDRGLGEGRIGAMHLLVRRVGLIDRIDDEPLVRGRCLGVRKRPNTGIRARHASARSHACSSGCLSDTNGFWSGGADAPGLRGERLRPVVGGVILRPVRSVGCSRWRR